MKNKIILLTFLYLLQKSSSFNYDDDSYVSIDEEEYAKPSVCRGYCDENNNREKRSNSPVRSRIVDTMMSSKILPLNPNEPDLFGFLRDQYELPKGEYKFKNYICLYLYKNLCYL